MKRINGWKEGKVLLTVLGAILAAGVVGALIDNLFFKPRVHPFDRKRELLLGRSMNMIHQFLNPTTVEGDLDYISKESRQKAEKLLNDYNEEVK